MFMFGRLWVMVRFRFCSSGVGFRFESCKIWGELMVFVVRMIFLLMLS